MCRSVWAGVCVWEGGTLFALIVIFCPPDAPPPPATHSAHRALGDHAGSVWLLGLVTIRTGVCDFRGGARKV